MVSIPTALGIGNASIVQRWHATDVSAYSLQTARRFCRTIRRMRYASLTQRGNAARMIPRVGGLSNKLTAV